MKKIIVLLVSLVAMQSTLKADNDKPIEFTQLPAQSQQLVKTHFADQPIAVVKMERELLDKTYEVIFTNGDKIEFDRRGNWKDIDCKQTEIPEALIPAQIKSYVAKHYPDTKIRKIEKEDRGYYDVDLSNRIELKFNSNFNLVDIDN